MFDQPVFRRRTVRPSQPLRSGLFDAAITTSQPLAVFTAGFAAVFLCFFTPVFCKAQENSQPKSIADPEQEKFFESEVRPLLVQHCVECHGPDDQSGELRLDRKVHFLRGGGSGPLIVDGDPNASRLIQAIGYQNNDLQMPPDSKMPDEAIAVLTRWVEKGAYWPAELQDGDAPSEANAEAAMSPAEQIDALRKSHWSFQPIGSKLSDPQSDSASQRETDKAIDRFVLERLAQAGMNPNPRADRRTLIHRAYFTLLGLPPSYEEVQAFVGDEDPDAFTRLVDRLLDNPHYGERWARHWMDIARYGDTTGYLAGSMETRYPYAFTYRDYVINAFNDDKPFDQFIIEQLAADQLGLEGEDRRALAAMGFLTVGRRFMNRQHDIIDDRIDVVTRGFLGLSVACSRCHDHKYDPIPTADYYSLYGVFASSQEPNDLPLLGEPVDSPEYQAFLAAKAEKQKEVDQWLEERRVETENELRSRVADYLVAVAENLPQYRQGDPSFQGKRGPLRRAAGFRWGRYLASPAESPHVIWTLWHHLAALPKDGFAEQSIAMLDKATELGSGQAANDDASIEIPKRVLDALRNAKPQSMPDAAQIIGDAFEAVYAQWNEARKADANLERLADPGDEQLRVALFDSAAPTSLDRDQMLGHLDQAQRDRYNQLMGTVNGVEVTHPGAPPRGMVMVDKPQPVNPVIFRRGVPGNRGDAVPRRFLQVLATVDGGKPFENGSGRLEMARAIASSENPLTARVIVNRIWQHQFGEGLVRTASDFGTRGELPTHPELLDHLAAEFIADGWSIKRLQRRIMLSDTWQQSSTVRADAAQSDPENRLLWHMPRRRMEFEPLRDRLLIAAGRLDDTIGGRSVMIHKDATRRGLYAYIDREDLPGLLASFDLPSPDASQSKRSETTVPQQALYLMNSEFVIQQARALADRTLSAKSADGANKDTAATERIRQIYRVALARDPDADELQAALQFVDSNSVQAFRQTQQQQQRESARWHFGYGHWNADSKSMTFQPFPYFDGNCWQASDQFPDPKMDHLRLTADGGHTGSTREQNPIRRWVAPVSGVVEISGTLKHPSPNGDGVRAQVVHSKRGPLADWKTLGGEVETKVERVEVLAGETLDFMADCIDNASFDSFHWAPSVRLVETESDAQSDSEYAAGFTWNAVAGYQADSEKLRPRSNGDFLDPWVQLAQVILLCNEFVFVD